MSGLGGLGIKIKKRLPTPSERSFFVLFVSSVVLFP